MAHRIIENEADLIAEIQKWVKRGLPQSAWNCRILLREIERLRAALNEAKNG